jgi:hypothetical protein
LKAPRDLDGKGLEQLFIFSNIAPRERNTHWLMIVVFRSAEFESNIALCYDCEKSALAGGNEITTFRIINSKANKLVNS